MVQKLRSIRFVVGWRHVLVLGRLVALVAVKHFQWETLCRSMLSSNTWLQWQNRTCTSWSTGQVSLFLFLWLRVLNGQKKCWIHRWRRLPEHFGVQYLARGHERTIDHLVSCRPAPPPETQTIVQMQIHVSVDQESNSRVLPGDIKGVCLLWHCNVVKLFQIQSALKLKLVHLHAGPHDRSFKVWTADLRFQV